MTDIKTTDEKLLAKIETAMKRRTLTNYDRVGYVFPNGSVCFVDDHGYVAEDVVEFFKIKHDCDEAIYYLLSLGIVRIGNNGEFYVEVTAQISSGAEKTILNVAAGQKYDRVFVDTPTWKRDTLLTKKIEKSVRRI